VEAPAVTRGLRGREGRAQERGKFAREGACSSAVGYKRTTRDFYSKPLIRIPKKAFIEKAARKKVSYPARESVRFLVKGGTIRTENEERS